MQIAPHRIYTVLRELSPTSTSVKTINMYYWQKPLANPLFLYTASCIHLVRYFRFRLQKSGRELRTTNVETIPMPKFRVARTSNSLTPNDYVGGRQFHQYSCWISFSAFICCVYLNWYVWSVYVRQNPAQNEVIIQNVKFISFGLGPSKSKHRYLNHIFVWTHLFVQWHCR